MGTGVVEDRRPPREDREERPPRRELPSFSRDAFGAEEAPEAAPVPAEREEKPTAPAPWRPGAGRAAPAADLGNGGSWRDTKDDDAPKKAAGFGGGNAGSNPFLARSQAEEKAKPKLERVIPQTQEELFQQQVAKAKHKEDKAKAEKEKGAGQKNLNPWDALGKKKKR